MRKNQSTNDTKILLHKITIICSLSLFRLINCCAVIFLVCRCTFLPNNSAPLKHTDIVTLDNAKVNSPFLLHTMNRIVQRVRNKRIENKIPCNPLLAAFEIERKNQQFFFCEYTLHYLTIKRMKGKENLKNASNKSR